MCFIYLRPYQNDPTLPEREQKQNLRSVVIILIAIAANTTMRYGDSILLLHSRVVPLRSS